MFAYNAYTYLYMIFYITKNKPVPFSFIFRTCGFGIPKCTQRSWKQRPLIAEGRQGCSVPPFASADYYIWGERNEYYPHGRLSVELLGGAAALSSTSLERSTPGWIWRPCQALQCLSKAYPWESNSKGFPSPLVLTLFWNICFRFLNHSDAFGCFKDIVWHQEELGF